LSAIDEHAAATEAFAGLLDEPEAWVIRPAYSVPAFAAKFPEVRRSAIRRLAAAAAGASSSRGLDVRFVPPALFIASSANQVRTLAPIWGTGASEHRVSRRVPGDIDTTLRALASIIEGRFAGIGVHGGDVLLRLTQARRRIDVGRRLLARTNAEVLVVANQHSLNCRALLHAARTMDVPSVYIAHAPYADNAAYRDLPVSVAGLRGPREVEAYAALGAPRDALHVVGNPSISDLSGERDRDGPIVLALSPHAPAVLAELIEATRSAVGTDVVVAPHPATSRRDVEPLLPRGWRVHDGSTQDLLRSGVACVIQRSSGVAWEALSLGTPVIEVSSPGQTPNYPLIAEPVVPIVTTAEELRAALDRVRADGHDAASARRAWAASWCEVVGDQAVERARQLIETSAGTNPEWALDAWRRG
jgi:hypothetical protein